MDVVENEDERLGRSQPFDEFPDGFHLERHDRVVIVSCCSGRGFKFIPRIGARAAALAREAAV